MKLLKIISSPKNINVVKVVRETSIWCGDESVYFTHDKNLNPIWMELEIKKAKKETKHYQERYENIFRGLCYWKSRALNESY